jgi:sugar phosphate isomerase/epimerase
MHLKDWRVAYEPDGAMRWTEAVPGEGQVPLLDILRVVLAVRPQVNIVLEAPVRPSPSEEETVAREWQHVQASARAARTLLGKV